MDVSPGRITQGALSVRTLPTPETVSTLVARLGALMGEARVGSPQLADTDDERETGQERFEVRAGASRCDQVRQAGSVRALRRLRHPVAVRMASFEIVAKAGPWRTSGKWWRRDGATWDRDAWDMELTDGRLVRVSRNRLTNNWELEGTYD